MGCLFPIEAFYSSELNPTGKRSLVFRKDRSHSGVGIQVPCGKCINCKLERARVWAVRCMHEKRSQSGAGSAFITLTYSEENLPPGRTLVRRDPQLFLKRLRKVSGDGLRFYGCGEYGETTSRPHYHIILFNFDFADKRFYKKSGSGEALYRSEFLSKTWGLGECLTGDVTFNSCAYVAGYCTKKITGDKAIDHYGGRLPEFGMYSKGIGSAWFREHHSEAYKHDSIIFNGAEMKIPRYYDKKFQDQFDQNVKPAGLVDTSRMAVLRKERRAKAMLHPEDNTHRRRRDRERFAELKAKLYKREFD